MRQILMFQSLSGFHLIVAIPEIPPRTHKGFHSSCAKRLFPVIQLPAREPGNGARSD